MMSPPVRWSVTPKPPADASPKISILLAGEMHARRNPLARKVSAEPRLNVRSLGGAVSRARS